jgi:hypothetical protein
MYAGDDNVRIGAAERKAAIDALSVHVAGGRLPAPEADVRRERVANAVRRADIRAVFADLPEPHPDLNAAVADESDPPDDEISPDDPEPATADYPEPDARYEPDHGYAGGRAEVPDGVGIDEINGVLVIVSVILVAGLIVFFVLEHIGAIVGTLVLAFAAYAFVKSR